MTKDKGAEPGADWLSAPVGTTSTTADDNLADRGISSSSAGSPPPATSRSDDTALTAKVSDDGSGNGSSSRYKSSFTNSLSANAGVYPGGSTTSPAYDAPLDPGPATSIGLGSATTGTATAVRPSKAAKRPAGRGPRRAKLQIRHIDPWSTLKLSLVLAVAFFFIWMIAVAVLYGVLSTMGVFESIDGLFAELGTDSGRIVTPKLVFGGAALIGAINIVLFTALATIGAYVYNLCADLAGGLEITLAERR